MTEEVEKKVCEGTVADLMKDKTGKQTVVTLTPHEGQDRKTDGYHVDKKECLPSEENQRTRDG